MMDRSIYLSEEEIDMLQRNVPLEREGVVEADGETVTITIYPPAPEQ